MIPKQSGGKKQSKQQDKGTIILCHEHHMDFLRSLRLGHVTSWQITVTEEEKTCLDQILKLIY